MAEFDPNSTSGAAWASVLAGAIGCATFGVLVDLCEAFPRFSKLLNLYNPTGDLSGKSTFAVVAWLGSWAMLRLLCRKELSGHPKLTASVVLVLIAFSLIATFPPFFELIAAH